MAGNLDGIDESMDMDSSAVAYNAIREFDEEHRKLEYELAMILDPTKDVQERNLVLDEKIREKKSLLPGKRSAVECVDAKLAGLKERRARLKNRKEQELKEVQRLENIVAVKQERFEARRNFFKKAEEDLNATYAAKTEAYMKIPGLAKRHELETKRKELAVAVTEAESALEEQKGTLKKKQEEGVQLWDEFKSGCVVVAKNWNDCKLKEIEAANSVETKAREIAQRTKDLLKKPMESARFSGFGFVADKTPQPWMTGIGTMGRSFTGPTGPSRFGSPSLTGTRKMGFLWSPPSTSPNRASPVMASKFQEATQLAWQRYKELKSKEQALVGATGGDTSLVLKKRSIADLRQDMDQFKAGIGRSVIQPASEPAPSETRQSSKVGLASTTVLNKDSMDVSNTDGVGSGEQDGRSLPQPQSVIEVNQTFGKSGIQRGSTDNTESAVAGNTSVDITDSHRSEKEPRLSTEVEAVVMSQSQASAVSKTNEIFDQMAGNPVSPSTEDDFRGFNPLSPPEQRSWGLEAQLATSVPGSQALSLQSGTQPKSPSQKEQGSTSDSYFNFFSRAPAASCFDGSVGNLLDGFKEPTNPKSPLQNFFEAFGEDEVSTPGTENEVDLSFSKFSTQKSSFSFHTDHTFF